MNEGRIVGEEDQNGREQCGDEHCQNRAGRESFNDEDSNGNELSSLSSTASSHESQVGRMRKKSPNTWWAENDRKGQVMVLSTSREQEE